MLLNQSRSDEHNKASIIVFCALHHKIMTNFVPLFILKSHFFARKQFFFS